MMKHGRFCKKGTKVPFEPPLREPRGSVSFNCEEPVIALHTFTETLRFPIIFNCEEPFDHSFLQATLQRFHAILFMLNCSTIPPLIFYNILCFFLSLVQLVLENLSFLIHH